MRHAAGAMRYAMIFSLIYAPLMLPIRRCHMRHHTCHAAATMPFRACHAAFSYARYAAYFIHAMLHADAAIDYCRHAFQLLPLFRYALMLFAADFAAFAAAADAAAAIDVFRRHARCFTVFAYHTPLFILC